MHPQGPRLCNNVLHTHARAHAHTNTNRVITNKKAVEQLTKNERKKAHEQPASKRLLTFKQNTPKHTH